MKRNPIRFILPVVGTLAVFMFLLVQSRRINEDAHNQYRTDLRQLEALHAVLNQDVLRAKLGLLTYYDPLNSTLNEIDQIRTQLDDVPGFIAEQGQLDIKDSLKSYNGLLVQQKALVERFKTENAILKNSLSYFTIVVSDLTSKATGTISDAAERETLNSLLQDILLYNTTADKALIPRIQEHIDVLHKSQSDTESSGNTSGVDLAVLINHTNLLVQGKPVIDSIIDQIFALPISNQILQQSDLYDAYFEVARQSTTFYQVALYVFSLLVVAYIAAFIILRLRMSSILVSQAKEALQVAYDSLEKRSGELEIANVELQTATAKAREASRLKGEFLANISHELRTPLNAIIGFSDMLLMGMSGALNDKQQHKIERLRENGTRLLTLINNVLDLTRIEAKRIEIATKPFEPHTLIKRLAAQMVVLVEQKHLELKTNIDPKLPSTLLGDEQRIEQVIVNLVSNAIKFTDSGSVNLDVSVDQGAQTWSIAVTDTGIGIPPHAVDIIFEEFRQVDGSSARAYKGSGLGLSITRNLVRIMEGDIAVSSELGTGSTFIITLPLRQELEPTVPVLEKTGV